MTWHPYQLDHILREQQRERKQFARSQLVSQAPSIARSLINVLRRWLVALGRFLEWVGRKLQVRFSGVASESREVAPDLESASGLTVSGCEH